MALDLIIVRVVIFAKTKLQARKVRFKVCTDLIETNSLITFGKM